jgi:hypothetical protein
MFDIGSLPAAMVSVCGSVSLCRSTGSPMRKDRMAPCCMQQDQLLTFSVWLRVSCQLSACLQCMCVTVRKLAVRKRQTCKASQKGGLNRQMPG